MEPTMFVSPTGETCEVVTPVVAVRMRARGWLPEEEVALLNPAALPDRPMTPPFPALEPPADDES